MGLINKPGTDGLSSIRKAILLLVVVVCVSASGCKGGSETIWSSETRSPDGKMIASARTVAQSGFGTGYIGTFVSLSSAKGSQPPIAILQLSDTFETPSDEISVEMKWLTPTHLELAYKGHRTLDFQAVKCSGVDISVQDLGSDKAQTGAVDSKNGARNLPTPPPSAYQKTAAPPSNH
jgi:hypothetical protein